MLLLAALAIPTVGVVSLYRSANDVHLAARDALTAGLRCTLPLALGVFFFAVPSRARALAPAFDCESILYDDATGATRSYLRADVRVECAGSEYTDIWMGATVALALWSVAFPLCLAALLHRA